MAEYQLLCVPPGYVPAVWPLARDLVARACDRCGVWSVDDFKKAVHDSAMLLWIVAKADAIKGAVITDLVNEGDERICVIRLGAGEDLKDWKHFKANFEQFARNEGCSRMRVEGRPGWVAFFDDYKRTMVTLEKSLINA